MVQKQLAYSGAAKSVCGSGGMNKEARAGGGDCANDFVTDFDRQAAAEKKRTRQFREQQRAGVGLE